MMLQLPKAFLLLTARADHVEEQSLSDVMIHHVANHYYQGMESWAFSKGVLMMLIAAVILMATLGWAFRKSQLNGRAPKGIANALEFFVLFIRNDIAIAHMGERFGRMFTPYLLTLFFFVLTCNLLGLVPGAYTATSNVNMTGSLAFCTLVLIIGSGLIVQGPVGYIKHMIPPGTPMALAPLLILIETISTFVKPIALMIRLGANMTAGHIVILSMISFIFIFKSFLVGIFFSVPLAVAIYLLEIIVAFIQAYVFTLLTALFVGMVTHSSH
ncbi:MAG: ATP synthase F0 subunit A [Solibacterales bacterium]|nr:ATP synthase F0 subunit A [Bryobacterales bacterium]|tara:strand:- start:221 stop:1033 length:813 start_codon:yes stop_codon:yes gene_type:complete